MIRPLVDYSDNDEDVEEEEEYVNNSNIADEEIWGTGKRIEKLITVKCVEKHTHHLGKGGISKSDEFLEKFQTAFDPPPPSFSENHVALFSGIHDRRSVYNGKNLQHKFLDWK